MPKQKITKEMVIEVAFEIAREKGLESVYVKETAEKLGCSVQPIYSYCTSMEGLRAEVTKRANEFVTSFIMENVDKNDFFRSTGFTYIKLAEEEPNIFKIFVMSERTGIDSMQSLYSSQSNPNVANLIARSLNISVEKAQELHLNMLIFTVGIGSILVNAKPGIPNEEILLQLEKAHDAFLRQALESE